MTDERSLIRMEKLDLKKVKCQAKVIGTVVTVAGAMLMTLYKGPLVEMVWSKHVHPGKSHVTKTSGSTDRDWFLGSILLIIATLAWASLFVLQVSFWDASSEFITKTFYWVLLANSLIAVGRLGLIKVSPPAEPRFYWVTAINPFLVSFEQTKALETYRNHQLSLTSLVCFVGTLQAIAVTFVMEHKTGVWKIGWDMNLLAAAYAVSFPIAAYLQPQMNSSGNAVFGQKWLANNFCCVYKPCRGLWRQAYHTTCKDWWSRREGLCLQLLSALWWWSSWPLWAPSSLPRKSSLEGDIQLTPFISEILYLLFLKERNYLSDIILKDIYVCVSVRGTYWC